MAKSRDAFRTISEVSDWLETPAHVLRFWESRFTQIKPVKRAGGRRYYRPGDMLLLGGIKQLLHDDGLTIKGVQKILREKGLKYVSGLSPDLDGSTDIKSVDTADTTPVEPMSDSGDDMAPSAVAESAPTPMEPLETKPISTPEAAQIAPQLDGSEDRLTALYLRLQSLRDRVSAEMKAA